MMLPYKVLVFDWEGTLSDPLGHIHQALSTEAAQLGLGVYDPIYARQFVSLGLDKAVRKIFPNLALHRYERLLQGVQQALVLNHADVYLYEGVRTLLQKFVDAKITLAIATNKGQQSLARALQVLDLTDFFAVTRSAGQAQLPAKPAPDMLEDILNVLGCAPNEALMIGDSVSDMEMASALNVSCIGVDFYYQQADELKQAGAQAVFHDFDQFEAYLEL